MDAAIVTWVVSNLRHPILDPIMIFFTNLGELGLVWIATGLCLCISKKYRCHGILMLLSLAVAAFWGKGS